jgi:hypothetical protein
MTESCRNDDEHRWLRSLPGLSAGWQTLASAALPGDETASLILWIQPPGATGALQ